MMNTRNIKKSDIALSSIFVLAITISNLMIGWFGPWVSPINAFFLIGLDLSIRDHLHEKWNGSSKRMLLLISIAGALSFLFNPAVARIAIASLLAFVVSSMADFYVYRKLIDKNWLKKSNYSNVAGATVDSVIFPVAAFGVFPGIISIILLQSTAKIFGGGVWSLVIDRFRKRA